MQAIGAVELNSRVMNNEDYLALNENNEKHALSGNGEALYSYGFKNQQGNPVIVQFSTDGNPKYTVMEVQMANKETQIETLSVSKAED